MAEIYHLVYTSRLSKKMTSKEFRELVAYSAQRNGKEHITGFLLERQGHFMQLLEGSEDAVLTCFTRIETDPRHGDIVIQADARSGERVVPN